MKQKIARLQHYVPQFLLKRFAGTDGRLWAYDAEKRKIFSSGPKGLAAESYFYGDTAKHATQESTAIERWLAEEIESPGADALDGLLRKRLLSSEQAHAFFRFVAAQMQRTPASLQRTSDCFAATFQETAERIAKHEPTFRKNAIASVKATGATAEEIADFVQILDEGKFTVMPTREFAISTAFRVLDVIAAELAKMRWTFLDVHPSDGDLIIGDHPVTLKDVAPEGMPAGALGVKNPNIEIAIPLSRRMVALAHWDGPISYGELAQGMAEVLNERALMSIHRFAFAPFESKELMARTIALRGTGPKTRTHRVKIGERVVISTEFR